MAVAGVFVALGDGVAAALGGGRRFPARRSRGRGGRRAGAAAAGARPARAPGADTGDGDVDHVTRAVLLAGSLAVGIILVTSVVLGRASRTAGRCASSLIPAYLVAAGDRRSRRCRSRPAAVDRQPRERSGRGAEPGPAARRRARAGGWSADPRLRPHDVRSTPFRRRVDRRAAVSRVVRRRRDLPRRGLPRRGATAVLRGAQPAPAAARASWSSTPGPCPRAATSTSRTWS